jgi:hypothetical protein
VVSGRRGLGLIDNRRRMRRAGAERTGASERVPVSVSATTTEGALSIVPVISTNVTRRRPATSSSIEASMSPPLSLPQSSLSRLSILFDLYPCSLRARRLAPCGVSPPGLLPARAPSVVSHHLRRLSPPLLASRAHSIGFR